MRLSAIGIAASLALFAGTVTAQADMHAHGMWGGKIDGAFSGRSATRSNLGAAGQAGAYRPTQSTGQRTYQGSTTATKVYATPSRVAGVGPRPKAWCGWWMRTQLGGGPEFNVAWNWRNYGRPLSGPQVGAVVVWRHHVGMITGQAANGKWIVKSGNDGGRVRERARSVKGAVFRG